MTWNLERRERVRVELERQRRRLLAREQDELSLLRQEGEAATGRVLDEAEASALDLQNELDGALLQIRGEAIRHIDHALVRLDEGDFGICRDCRGGIGERRLSAMPFAEQCLACANREESRTARLVRAVPSFAARPLEADDDAAA
jgi:DnaK suppressor protein